MQKTYKVYVGAAVYTFRADYYQVDAAGRYLFYRAAATSGASADVLIATCPGGVCAEQGVVSVQVTA